MTLSLTPVSLAFLPVTLARVWRQACDNVSSLQLTRSSHFFVSEVGMVSKCLSRQAPWPAVSWCLQSPAQPAAVCTAALGPQTAVVCSAAVRVGGGQSSSVSQSSTDKNVPFYHHQRVPAVQPGSNPRLVHLSPGVRGLDSQKSSPAPAGPSRSFAFTQRSAVAKTQTSLSLKLATLTNVLGTLYHFLLRFGMIMRVY